MIAQIS